VEGSVTGNWGNLAKMLRPILVLKDRVMKMAVEWVMRMGCELVDTMLSGCRYKQARQESQTPNRNTSWFSRMNPVGRDSSWFKPQNTISLDDHFVSARDCLNPRNCLN